MSDQGRKTAWGTGSSSNTNNSNNKRRRDVQDRDEIVVVDSDDDSSVEMKPRQKSRPAGTTPPARYQHKEELDLSWRTPQRGENSRGGGGGAALDAMEDEEDEDDGELLHHHQGGARMTPSSAGDAGTSRAKPSSGDAVERVKNSKKDRRDDDDEEDDVSTQAPEDDDEGEEEEKDETEQMVEGEEEEEEEGREGTARSEDMMMVEMIVSSGGGGGENKGGENRHQQEEAEGEQQEEEVIMARGNNKKKNDVEEDSNSAFHTAEPLLKGSPSEAVMSGARAIYTAMKQHGKDSEEFAKEVRSQVEYMYVLLEPLYPTGKDDSAMTDLFLALAKHANQATKNLMRDVANNLEKVEKNLSVCIPAKDHSGKPFASLTSSSGDGGVTGGPRMHGDNSAKSNKVEDIFDAKLQECDAVLQAYSEEDEKRHNVEQYAKNHKANCDGVLKTLKERYTQRKKRLEDSRHDEKTARKALLDLDLAFKAMLTNTTTTTTQGVGELEIISRVLGAAAAAPNLFQDRTAADRELQARERDRVVAEQKMAIMEAFAAVVEKLVGGATMLAEAQVTKVIKELQDGQTQLADLLKQRVVDSSLKLQNLIEYHELRQSKVAKNISETEYNLRQEKELYGSEAPAFFAQQENAVRELREVARRSHKTIEDALNKNNDFYESVDSLLPPDLANELRSLFHKNMTCHSELMEHWSQQYASSSQLGGGALLSPSGGGKKAVPRLTSSVAVGAAPSASSSHNCHYHQKAGPAPQPVIDDMVPLQGSSSDGGAASGKAGGDDKGCSVM